MEVHVREAGANDDAKVLRGRIRKDGTFSAGPLAPGSYEVRVSMARGARASAWHGVEAPAEGLELAPAEGGSVVVRVLGEHAGLEAALLGEDGRVEQVLESARGSGPEATYTVPMRAAGGTLLLTERYSGRHARHEGVQAGDDVTIRLERGTPTRARLPNVPWPFAPVWAKVDATDGRRTVIGSIDDAARFVTFQGLPPGRWTIEARVGVDRTYVFRAIDVEPGQQDVLLALVESDLAAK
ncbi:MAG: hypothetical protein R3F05_05765 [Planctomycetota bacterium]